MTEMFYVLKRRLNKYSLFFLFTLFKSKIFTKVPLHRNDQNIGLILKRLTAEMDIRHCYRGWTNQRD